MSDYDKVRDALNQYVKEKHFSKQDIEKIEIVSGHCPSGADMLGEKFAKINHLQLSLFPADWNKYGKAAGPIRNEKMAQYASQDNGVLMAFWDGKSHGTKNMIALAKQYHLEVHVFNIK